MGTCKLILTTREASNVKYLNNYLQKHDNMERFLIVQAQAMLFTFKGSAGMKSWAEIQACLGSKQTLIL
eukprot:118256-Pelagomonas_calceolata.AAC.2